MIKEIKYTGYTAQPSDYEAPDGQLAFSLNLLQEGEGAIHPIMPPSKIRSFASGQTPIFQHKATGATYLIITERKPTVGRSFLYFCDYNDSSSPIKYFGSFTGKFLSCTAVGNTLIVVSSDGMQYYLYKDGGYTELGDRPPFVSISFGMARKGQLDDGITSEYANCPIWSSDYFVGSAQPPGRRTLHPKTAEDEALLNSYSTAVMGLLLSSVAENVTSKSMFYQPFFVRYAFRLFDGSYAWHSAPVLMLPEICPPRVRILEHPTIDSSRTLTIKYGLQVPYFALTKRICADGLEDLEKWADLITSVDVFVSAPIYTYSQSDGVQGWCSMASLYARREVYASDFSTSSSGSSTSSGNHRPSNSSQPSTSREPVPEYAFVGHYATSVTGSSEDRKVKLSDYVNYAAWDIMPAEKFEESIIDCNLFYLYKSIPLKEIQKDNEPVVLMSDNVDLSQLVTRQVLADDWQSHFQMMPTYATVYNSRVHLCGMNLRLPDPLPIASSVAATGNSAQQSSVSVRVWSIRNGVKCSVVSKYHTDADLFPLSSELPRWLWYPDPSAYMMMLQQGSQTIILNLKPHPTLNGAYWFAGLDADPTVENAESDPVTLPEYALVPSKVYVSDATNPFSFPATGVITVGSGTVFALSSAAKALSQGQFGQFPLYAFTSEGVWALEVSSTGVYSARQPITRDVCNNVDGITQIDSSVLFPSDRGIMLLSGSTAQCISDSIDTIVPLETSSLPRIS